MASPTNWRQAAATLTDARLLWRRERQKFPIEIFHPETWRRRRRLTLDFSESKVTKKAYSEFSPRNLAPLSKQTFSVKK